MAMILSKSSYGESSMLSVITVVYNAAEDLQCTLTSVLSQQDAVFEYIVVDGGSAEETMNVIRQNDANITRWVSEPDKGIYDAMNKGVRLASGRYVLFMNAGDLFHDEEAVRDILEAIKANDDALIWYGDALIVNDNGKHVQHQEDRHLDLTKSIIHQSMIIRRSHLLDHPYDIRYRIMADYDHLLEVSVPSPAKVVHIKRTICIYNKFGISSRPLHTYFQEYYEIARKRMPLIKFLQFNFYILPRLIFSLRHFLRRR